MTLSRPSLTTSVFVPKTCARRVLIVSRGAESNDGRGRCAEIPFRLELLGTVIFTQLTPGLGWLPKNKLLSNSELKKEQGRGVGKINNFFLVPHRSSMGVSGTLAK